jgi:hypothetical protein
MGWWPAVESNGTIGDGPADSISLAVRSILDECGSAIDLVSLCRAAVSAISLNRSAIISNPDELGTIIVSMNDGPQIEIAATPEKVNPTWIEDLYRGFEDASFQYRDVCERKPTLSELLETFAFVVRGYDADEVQGAVELATIKTPPVSNDGDIRILLDPKISVPDIEALLSSESGLVRDADATEQPDPPLLASWTRPPPSDLEADYHFDPALKTAWLEIRGQGAGRLAPILAKALGGKVAPAPDVAMADLLTPPSGADDSGTGRIRWQTLCAIVVTDSPAPSAIVQPLIRAGLADPDWRVRMIALIGAGHFALRDLVSAIEAASIPKAGTHGLNQDDRHTLLALRHAAKDLANGSNAPIPADNVETLDRRHQFLESIKTFVMTLQMPAHPDRSHALLAALTGQSEGDDRPFPAAWAGWLYSTSTQ